MILNPWPKSMRSCAAEKEGGHPIAILADLQGPKLRLGTFVDGEVMLVEGQTFRLDLDDTPGDDMRAQLPHPEIFKVVKDGAILLLNDGKVRLKVIDHGEDFANTMVEIGGEISDRKGVNVPGVVVPLSALTEKDRRDLDAALALGVDWVGLSFVQRPEDVQEARKIVAGRAGVMVKVEKPAAVDCFDENHRHCRWGHGGARRSGGGNAAGSGTGNTENVGMHGT